jgi:hypothetical protein
MTAATRGVQMVAQTGKMMVDRKAEYLAAGMAAHLAGQTAVRTAAESVHVMAVWMAAHSDYYSVERMVAW